MLYSLTGEGVLTQPNNYLTVSFMRSYFSLELIIYQHMCRSHSTHMQSGSKTMTRSFENRMRLENTRVVEILGSEFCNVYFHNIGVFLFYDVGFKLSIKSEKAALG